MAAPCYGVPLSRFTSQVGGGSVFVSLRRDESAFYVRQKMKKHIISIGGGGFQNERAPALDRYMLGLCSREKPRVCCIPTASGEWSDFLIRFYSTFTQYECTPCHLSFFRSPISDYRSLLADCDLAYVMGGNTRAMLAVWREWGLDRILRERYEQGTVLAGNSAGAICWFDQGHTDSNGPVLSPLSCLGFLPGSCSPQRAALSQSASSGLFRSAPGRRGDAAARRP
jgi:peptidase E